MKANVGMLYPVAAPVNVYTPYSGITYSAGFVVSEARGANISWETEDGEFRGDDVLLDSAKGILGYSLDFESTGLSDTVRKKLLGEEQVGTSDVYKITGKNAPDVGFGFIRRVRDDSSGSVVEKFEAWWFYRLRFAQPNEESRTKERQIEWRVPTLNGTGSGVYLAANADDPDFAEHEDFESLSGAKSYLQSKAGISG